MNMYSESLVKGYGQTFSIDNILFEHKTPHQHLVIFENEWFGRVMALDGIIQTTEKDEFIYHEMLTHVPVLAHGHVKSALIIGGGDGGTLRELTKHQSIETITLVEIDRSVIDTCQKLLPKHSDGAFDYHRLTLVIDDGMNFVSNTEQSFDLIISDCTDPTGPGEVLFSTAFYQACKECLEASGVFVAQNGVPFFQPEELTTSSRRLRALYADRCFYGVAVPTYVGGLMTLAWATENPALREVPMEELTKRYQSSTIETHYYSPEVHHSAFSLPGYINSLIEC